jgi:hypothetical protein
MSEYFSDCKPLRDKIMNKELGKNDINQIISD